MTRIYFVTTLNCSNSCGHCYLAAGPGKKDTTISLPDFKSVIDHLPKSNIELNISGGEVFTIKDSLYAFLEYVKGENQRPARANYGDARKIHVTVQTNGFWAKNPDIVHKTLKELVELNVTRFDISSLDKYHKAAGIDMERPMLLRKIASDSNYFNMLFFGGASRDKKNLLPIGRAKEFRVPLSDLYCDFQPYDCEDFLKERKLTIREDGSVYACCFSQFKLPGNIIEDSYNHIHQMAAGDARLRALSRGGIRGLALRDGFERKDVDESIESLGNCGFCYAEYIKPGHGTAR
jgi:MoaA/NifB/PqqE/SkfB family radical SAM enzyme